MDSPPGIRTSELEKEFGVHKVIPSGSLLLVAFRNPRPSYEGEGGEKTTAPTKRVRGVPKPHPHERIERETTEADERMGAAKAARWRRAWGG